MRILLALLALPALAFQVAETKTGTPKPTPREKALELLVGALDMVPGAEPEVAATALMRIGENLETFSHSRAIETLNRAFEVSFGIPAGPDARRERVQSLIAAAAVPLSLPGAVSMLKRMDVGSVETDPRPSAIAAGTSALVASGRYDEALELIAAVGYSGKYPFLAALEVYKRLRSDDVRRPAIFTRALSAYTLRPSEEYSGFLTETWRSEPRATAEAAARQISETLLGGKDDDAKATSATLKMLPVVRAIDPSRAGDILERRPELKTLLNRHPDGDVDVDPGDPGDAALLRTSEILSQLQEMKPPEDPSADDARAYILGKLEIARNIPLPELRIDVLAGMVAGLGDHDPDLTKSVLNECLKQLKDTMPEESGDPVARGDMWTSIAEAAHEVHDDQLAWEAIGRALDDAGATRQRDTRADHPNPALRDQWPSTTICRGAIAEAVELFGVDLAGTGAQALLARIPDRDLALFARVEMAHDLLKIRSKI